MESPRAPTGGAGSGVELHLLDVGTRQYGDSILCLSGGHSILVDGAHPGDEELVLGQLRSILGTANEVTVDLLVVTHAHDDHIGSLPGLVDTGALRAKSALVASVAFAWPGSGTPDLPGDQASVLAGLREEDLTPLTDDELDDALASARDLEQRYAGMLSKLRDGGTAVTEYDGNPPPALVDGLAKLGVTILGPHRRHLELASQALHASREDLHAALMLLVSDPVGAKARPAELYRALRGGGPLAGKVALPAGAAQASERAGAAVNAESIVLAVGPPGARSLLTGDMQFGEPGVPGELAQLMGALWDEVRAAGPYEFTKLAHHGSPNGSPAGLADELGCAVFGMSTGTESLHHPSCKVIQDLAHSAGIRWIRTDRNGQSTVDVEPGKVSLAPARGSLNDPACH